MKFNFFLLFLLLLIFNNCSYLIESDKNTNVKKTSKPSTTRAISELFCKKKSKSIFSKNNIFINKIKFPTEDLQAKIVIHALQEMMANPNYFSDHTRLQIIYKNDKGIRYFETPKTDHNSLTIYDSLALFLQTEKNKKSFEQILLETENLLDLSLPVSLELSNFIKGHIKQIAKDDVAKGIFLRGDDALVQFETFKRKTFSKAKMPLITKNISPAPIGIESFQAYPASNTEIKCNFDLGKIQSFTSALIQSGSANAYYFGSEFGKNQFYLVIATTTFDSPLETSSIAHLFKGKPTEESIPLCFYEDDKKTLIISSIEGRDPAQHLSHFIDYDFFESENTTDLLGHMTFSRHLFLKNPDRLLFESHKTKEEQLQFFYSMNLPLYHMDKIGESILFGAFEKNKESSFVLDERSGAKILCQ